MKLAVIAAIGKNRVIGKNGKLPWHISDDLKRFKRLTTGHAVLMGRKTWESLGKPLTNRRNVVLTSKTIPGVESYARKEAALEALRDQQKVFVIGGARVYSELLYSADELFLTFVDQEVDGDAYFPPYEQLLKDKFMITRREEHEGFVFVDYERTPKK
jgi:dihydrofolate reductase